MRRFGRCNHCGQCCENGPWPGEWPDSLRNWLVCDLPRIVRFVGDVYHGCKAYSQITINNEVYHWIWVPARGLCKDVHPFGDQSTYILECPFLMPTNDRGERLCALVGSSFEWVRDGICVAIPLDRKNAKEVKDWYRQFPKCSYRWK
jgi:Fe-S-cluster containining protein